MSTVSAANLVAFVSALITFAGVSGITSTDVSGFVNVLFGLITLAGIAWSHFAHRAQVQALSAGAVRS